MTEYKRKKLCCRKNKSIDKFLRQKITNAKS